MSISSFKFAKLALAVAAGIALTSGVAMAEQTIGVQPATTTAIATAKVAVSVIVPKIVILRVGAADATVATVTFTVAPTGVTGAPGNSLAYNAGAIPPVLATTIATTNPTTTAGVLVADAWTNAAANAQLTCALSAHPSITTGFAVGATTAAGVPGTDTITVSGSVLGHPGTNLTGCTGTPATAAITKLTTYTGTYTYGFTGAATTAAGSYGNTVTYTATTL